MTRDALEVVAILERLEEAGNNSQKNLSYSIGSRINFQVVYRIHTRYRVKAPAGIPQRDTF